MNELEVIFLEEAQEFLVGLPTKVRDKVVNNIRLVIKGHRNIELFKKLEGTEIWEFRTEYERKAYRLLSFWDKEERSLVVATHGFIKKKQKTPKKEIEKAESLRQQYLKNK